jgi:hypothetical protein
VWNDSIEEVMLFELKTAEVLNKEILKIDEMNYKELLRIISEWFDGLCGHLSRMKKKIELTNG